MTTNLTPDNWRQSAPTLCEMFEATVRSHGACTYVSTLAGDLSYAQAYTVIDHLAIKWASLVAGQDVVVLLPNSVAFLVCYQALLRAGATPALINVGMPEAAVSRLLSDLNPALVLSLDPVDGFEHQLVNDDLIYQLADNLDAAKVSPSSLNREEIGVILFSGGTTGLPKRIRHSHGSLMAMVERMEWGWPTVANETWLPVAPFTHIYGYLMGVANPVLKGGTLVIPSRFQPDLIVDLLASRKVSIFGGGPPAIYQALLSAERFNEADLTSLRVCPGGGASFPEAVHKRWREATGLTIHEGIGMTEIAPMAVNTEHFGTRLGTAGKPCPDTDIEIVDLEHGERILQPGETGEIRVKGPHMMNGYDNDPDETARTIRDGFIYTGDIGLLDEQGFLRITDRKKDVIFYKGFNVFPREVEEVLMEHDSVLQAAVVGCDDERAGEVPVAFVTASRVLEEGELLLHCEDLLTDYKLPRSVILLEELPLTAARKVDRQALRTMASHS